MSSLCKSFQGTVYVEYINSTAANGSPQAGSSKSAKLSLINSEISRPTSREFFEFVCISGLHHSRFLCVQIFRTAYTCAILPLEYVIQNHYYEGRTESHEQQLFVK